MKTNKILIILISLSVIKETQAAQLRQFGQRLGQFGRQMMNQGQALKEAAQPGLQAAKQAAQSGAQATRESVAPLTEGLQGVRQELGEGLGNGGWWQQVKDAMPTLRQGTRQFMGNTVESLGNRAQQFGTNLQQTRNTFRQELADQFQPGRQMLGTTLGNGLQSARSGAQGFGPALRQQVQGAQAGLSSSLQSIRTKLGNVGSGLGTGLQNVGNSLTSTAQSYGSSLRNRLGGLKTQLSELSPFSWGAQTPARAHELALSEQLPVRTYNELVPLAAKQSGVSDSQRVLNYLEHIEHEARQDAADQSVLGLGHGYDGDLSSRIGGEYSGPQLSPNDLLAKIAEEQVILAQEQQKLDELAVVAARLADVSAAPFADIAASADLDALQGMMPFPSHKQGDLYSVEGFAPEVGFTLVPTEEAPRKDFRLNGGSYNPEADQLPEVDRQSRNLVRTEAPRIPFVIPSGVSHEGKYDIDLSPEASLTHHSDPLLVDRAPVVGLDAAPAPVKVKKAIVTTPVLSDTQLKKLLDQRAAYSFAPSNDVVKAYNEAQSYQRALEDLPDGVKVPGVDVKKDLKAVSNFIKENQRDYTDAVMQTSIARRIK